MPPPFLDPDQLNDMATLSPSNVIPPKSATASNPILVLSPSSLSHRPQVLESLLSSFPSSQPHHLQMLDRIALNFVNLPANHYADAFLALPPTEEETGEVENDYKELKAVLSKILETMQPGGKIRIGQPKEDVTQEAIITGFLVESQDNQVCYLYSSLLLIVDDTSQASLYSRRPTPSQTTRELIQAQETFRPIRFRRQ